MHLTDRKWQRRRQKGAFDVDESDRLYRIARVVQRTIEVLGSEGKARSWLTRPNRTLGMNEPLELISSDQGSNWVTDELARIDSGDLY